MKSDYKGDSKEQQLPARRNNGCRHGVARIRGDEPRDTDHETGNFALLRRRATTEN